MAEILNYVDIDQQLNSIYNYKQHPITSASMVISSSILGVNDKGFAVYNIDDNSPYWWDGVEFKTFPSSSGGYIDTSSLVLTSSFNNFTSSYNTGSFTGSFIGDGSQLTNLPTSSIDTSSLVTTSSFFLFTSSYYSDSSSFDYRINNITIDTSSLVTTSSFNNFTSSYNTGSFTGSFYGNGNGLEINKIISGSVSASISYENGLQINTDVFGNSFQVYDDVTQQWIVFSSFENGFNITYQDGTNLIFAQDGEFSIGDISNNDMATIRNTLLTENRVYDYPDKDGVIALLSDILNITGSFVTTSSFNNFITFYNTGSFTGSFIGDGSQLTNLPTSSIDTSSFILNSQTSSMSVSSSLYSISSSHSSTASYYNETDPIFISKSGSYATTGSNSFIGNQKITGSLYITGSTYISGGIEIIDFIDFNTTASQAGSIGRMIWNDTDGTLDLGLKGGNVTLQIGQEQVTRVVNKTGVNLLESEYKAVYISGAQGNRVKVDLALGNNDLRSNSTLGLVTENINNNQEGFITTGGLIRNINTTGTLQGETWNDGDVLYLSSTIPGQITNIKPIAPNHLTMIGYVVNANPSVGSIYVKIQIGYGLGESHDALINTSSLSNGDLLIYSSSVWVNRKQLTGSYGLTGSLNATSFTGSLQGTSSYSLSSSFAVSSSFTQISISSSYAQSSSQALTASFAPNYLLVSSTGSMLNPYVLTSSTSSMSVLSSSFAISSSHSITASYIPGGDVWSMTITTTSSVDTNTTGSSGYDQNGRHTKISNGASAINWTVQTSSHADFVGSYEKIGTSNITFIAGAGATLTTLSGTAILSGIAGSKACLSRNGNTYYLQITNY